MVSPNTPQNSFTVLRSLKPSLSQIAVKDMNKLDSTALQVNFSQIKRKKNVSYGRRVTSAEVCKGLIQFWAIGSYSLK